MSETALSVYVSLHILLSESQMLILDMKKRNKKKTKALEIHTL